MDGLSKPISQTWNATHGASVHLAYPESQEASSACEPVSKCPFPISRTLWGAGLTPHRPLLESLASSTYGTAFSGRTKSSALPTAPRICRETSSHGWTTTSMCSEGLPSGLWRPVRSVSWICSYLLLVQEARTGLWGVQGHLFPNSTLTSDLNRKEPEPIPGTPLRQAVWPPLS